MYLVTFLALQILKDETHRFPVDYVQEHGFDFFAVVIGFAERTLPSGSAINLQINNLLNESEVWVK